ncbi:MAG: arginine--tRNA ligase, partial [Parcubacteria group bacterium]|nr:arginine--tRNA ligase [Parcubacteria group bacterium]
EILKNKIRPTGLIKKIESAGPYLNFYLDNVKLAKTTLKQIAREKQKYGNSTSKQKKTYIEYVSPNTNKPLHLGHLRNGFLGETISNLFETQGYRAIRGVLNNDRGMGISKSMLMYQKFGKDDSPKKSGLKSDHFVGKYYVMYEKKSKKNKGLEKELHDLLQKWENGDKKTLVLWKKMNGWALQGYKETYKRLGVKFDKEYFESAIYKEGRLIVEQGLKKKKFQKDSAGNIIAEFKNMPDRVLLRADGTAVYATNDLAYVKKVFKENKVGKFIYVVGSEQELYFKQLFEIFEQLGWKHDVYHLNYGLVNLPEGRMKSREGTVVDADDLITRMEEYAAKEIKARHDFLEQTKIEKRAAVIALAALKYFILNVGPRNNMTYNPRASLSFTGNTGPYLLYTYARISNILKKADKKIDTSTKINFSYLNSDAEHQIIMMLADFENILKKSLDSYDPSELTKYLFTLAKNFSDFYRDVHVLDAEKEVTKTRLFFLDCIREVFEKGFKILGIEPLKKM